LPFDLSGAERYVTHDQLGAGVADHVHPRDARHVIVPRMPPKPCVQRLASAVKVAATVVLR
jgi:hypothetical protein